MTVIYTRNGFSPELQCLCTALRFSLCDIQKMARALMDKSMYIKVTNYLTLCYYIWLKSRSSLFTIYFAGSCWLRFTFCSWHISFLMLLIELGTHNTICEKLSFNSSSLGFIKNTQRATRVHIYPVQSLFPRFLSLAHELNTMGQCGNDA